jgi:protein gp37
MTKGAIKHGTAIEWTQRPGTRGETWNPIRAKNRETGKLGWHCTHKSDGCRNCYAERINVKPGATGGTGLAYKPGHEAEIEIFLSDALLNPLRWKRPCTIFVCSMTDLFADFVTDAMLDRIFAVMALCPQHTFIVLTKRPERMRRYIVSRKMAPNATFTQANICQAIDDIVPDRTDSSNAAKDRVLSFDNIQTWPMPNIWLGVSVEDQATADERIPVLLETPSALRFLSVEPLLSALDLTHIRETLVGESYQITSALDHPCTLNKGRCRQGVDWVICGGESGPNARPMHPDWARALRDQCAATGVPFFFKQWGEWNDPDPPIIEAQGSSFHHFGFLTTTPPTRPLIVQRVGKRAAGRTLDGREHNEFPEGAA